MHKRTDVSINIDIDELKSIASSSMHPSRKLGSQTDFEGFHLLPAYLIVTVSLTRGQSLSTDNEGLH